ncbi:glycoside hydrolase superfamily [Globomyces pollinis-pini]|nr:glycoside hydrolase superfamily [Globomyces pollinis-pini]
MVEVGNQPLTIHSNDSAISLNYKNSSPSIHTQNKSLKNTLQKLQDTLEDPSLLDTTTTSNVISPPSPESATSEDEFIVPIAQLDKSIFHSNPVNNPWQSLDDNNDPWAPSEDNTTSTVNQNFSPLSVWNPTSQTWSTQRPPAPPPPPSIIRSIRSFKLTRKQSINCILFGLLFCLTMSATIAFTLHALEPDTSFDGSLGPRGSAPGTYDGQPLPVLGVLQQKNFSSSAVYFGVALDWNLDDPENFNNDLGYATSIQDVVFYMNNSLNTRGFVNSSGIIHSVPDVFIWTADLIRKTGAVMGVTVVPTVPLNTLTNSTYQFLGQKCRQINDMGIPIMLRYAPDMNGKLYIPHFLGNWHIYGQNPTVYRKSFRDVAKAIRNSTNNTAMVWAPTSGLEYPYGRGLFSPGPNESRLLELDTSGNGILDSQDDPFLPYYPGDDVVDWAGFSAFYTSDSPLNLKLSPVGSLFAADPPNFMNDSTSDTLPVSNLVFNNSLPVSSLSSFESQLLTAKSTHFNFYRDFCQARNKPFILTDTGGGYFKGSPVRSTTDEATLKRSWYSQIMNNDIIRKYPLIRAVIFYNSVISLNQTTLNLTATESYPQKLDFGLNRNRTVLMDFKKILEPLVPPANYSGTEPVFLLNNSSLANSNLLLNVFNKTKSI